MREIRRRTWGVRAAWVVVLLTAAAMPVLAQGTLSQQVLALLTRVNSWTTTNTFYDLRIPVAAVPGDTSARIYSDLSANLYYNGTLLAGSGGVTNPHNLLSTTHPDTLVGSPTRGAVVVGNSTPKWATVTASSGFLQYNGTDTVFSTSLANGTAIPAAQLTGTLPAISGVNLTSLNATNLGSGTVPLARLSGITNTEISGAAAIAYSKLNLSGAILNADISGSAAIAYSKLNLSNAIVAGDLTSSSVTMAKIAQAGATSNQVIQWNGSAWAPASLASGGTVTSIGLALPGIFSVSGSPVTGSGTITASLASQTANYVWAAPNGSAGAPTFRAFVNADLPTSGVAAGTYASLTVNDRGIATAASTTMNLATQATGTLARANGGTGVTVSADDTTLVGSGSAWVATALPNCTQFLRYATATNLFSCSAAYTGGTLTANTPMQLTQNWSNAGVNFVGFTVDITDTNSTTSSYPVQVNVGGSTMFQVRKDGQMGLGALTFANLTTPANGSISYCSDCTIANPCAGGGTGAIAKRLNGVWVCN